MGKEAGELFKFTDCIDSGTDYCPCALAEKGECIICSQLKDKVFCDCLNWKGTCIYQEFIDNNSKRKKARQYKTCSIIKRQNLREDILLFDIKVNNALARELNNTGAFVFLRNPSEDDSYNTPISIMESDVFNNIIKVVVKIAGVKTKSLAECRDKIMVKGPYWNGIQGIRFIKDIKDKGCLILTRGCAAAPAVMAARKMIKNGNRIYVMVDRGRSVENFSKAYFMELGCVVEDVSFYNDKKEINEDIKYTIKQLIEKKSFDVVLSAGEDEFHRNIIRFLNGIDKGIDVATVNNSTMCCGEGICGSCQIKGISNEKIKSCKQQYNPAEVFLKGMGD
ncbi:MAG: sulfide/dihydroorotate dehydrogenase-like FAD/NAD-binding protein [Clostridiales bacterium]|jgi:NAD(P)H-flavin reductase|nr:sulfide/dihydroorotate dehydrogenase-like FAD/NAD-binding protein [Clostridiales bacterium]